MLNNMYGSERSGMGQTYAVGSGKQSGMGQTYAVGSGKQPAEKQELKSVTHKHALLFEYRIYT